MSAEAEKRVHGYMAEFDSVPTLMAACRRVRDAGYTKTDAYTPFPVHGIDEALGIKPTVLPWIALAGGLTGTITAFSMEIWMNGIDYQYIISGKQFISLPAFVPVGFELTILLASFGAFFGMLALNKLPMFANPVFTHPRFDAATDDKFFLYIGADDPRYDENGVKKLLAELSSQPVDPVVDDGSSDTLPKPFISIVAAAALLSLIPLLFVARMRVTTSGSPRFHVFYDMDFAPSKHTQRFTTIFEDGRTMRPNVAGTVSRGDGGYDPNFYSGINVEALAMTDPARAERLVRFNGQPPADEPAQEPASGDTPAVPETAGQDPVTQPAEEAPAEESPAEEAPASPEPEVSPQEPIAIAPPEAAEPAAEDQVAPAPPATEPDTTPWLTENPLPVDIELLNRGQKFFNIYCAVCHGQDGSGNGLVNARAAQTLAPNWVPPTSLHTDAIQKAVYAEGKLFSTITNGIRKMPGYGAQIKAEDRWAIVAYVRALQLSQNAPEAEVPGEFRDASSAK